MDSDEGIYLMAFRLSLVLLVLLVVSCSSVFRPIKDGYEPPPNIVEEEGKDLCDEVCRKIGPSGLSCEEGLPVEAPDDWNGSRVTCAEGEEACVSCVDFCVYQHENGVTWNTACIVREVNACADIEAICNP